MDLNLSHDIVSKKPIHQDRYDDRHRWYYNRAALESEPRRTKRQGTKQRFITGAVDRLAPLLGLCLRLIGLYKRGYRNAENIVVNGVDLHYPDIPASFAGYRILHLTDLHLDSMAGTADRIVRKINGLECDLCVITGDYRKSIRGEFEQILYPMEKIVAAVNAKDGIVVTLGNHDTYRMTAPFEEMGVTVLANETMTIYRGNETISVTGVDDPHEYYSESAIAALTDSIDGFKVALVHTPELYDYAADKGYRLYLCGHTHGGQICLPGGIPLITHLNRGKRYYRGFWQFAGMKGYTNQGCGAIGIPIRFNTQSEVALITLHNGKSAH